MEAKQKIGDILVALIALSWITVFAYGIASLIKVPFQKFAMWLWFYWVFISIYRSRRDKRKKTGSEDLLTK